MKMNAKTAVTEEEINEVVRHFKQIILSRMIFMADDDKPPVPITSIDVLRNNGSFIGPAGTNEVNRKTKYHVQIGTDQYFEPSIVDKSGNKLPNPERKAYEALLQRPATQADVACLLESVACHEILGHGVYTSFKEISKLLDFGKNLFASHCTTDYDKSVIERLLSFFDNAIEDARIENLSGIGKPSIALAYTSSRYNDWALHTDKLSNDEFRDFAFSLLFYACLGVFPKFWDDPTTAVDRADMVDAVKRCIPYVNAHEQCDNAKKAREIEQNMLIEIKDYLDRLFKDEVKKANDKKEAFEEFLKGLEAAFGGIPQVEGSSTDGDGDPTGFSTRVTNNKNQKTKGNTEGAKPDLSKADKHKRSGETREESSSVDNNSAGYGEQAETYTDEDELTTINPDLEAKLRDAAAKQAARAESSFEDVTEPKEEIDDGCDLDQDELEDALRRISTGGYDFCSVKVSSNAVAPEKWNEEADEFRQNVEEAFQEAQYIRIKDTGKLLSNRLSRIATGDDKMFTSRARDLGNAAVSICWDGSGSMCGEKQNQSARAVHVIERGLKGMVPLKIINFTTEWRNRGADVVHYIVKDFEDNDMDVDYAYSYASSRGFSGGNRDGYSIGICTEELIRRPEDRKLLIVLSDGLPSDYNGGEKGEADVAANVQYARDHGVEVISIFFGNKCFREEQASNYKDMYGENNIISADVDQIAELLTEQIKAALLG